MAVPPNPFDPDQQPPAAAPANEPGSDIARSFTGGLIDLGAQAAGGIAALQRQAGNPAAEASTEVQDRLNEASKIVKDAMSPTGKAIANADWTSAEGLRTKLSHPFQAAGQAGAEMAPMLLGATLLPEGLAGVAAGSTLWGTQGILQQMNRTRDTVMSTPDDELQAKTPLYKALRQDYDEPTARQKLVDAGNDVRSLMIAGGANALAGGALAHLMGGGPATQGFLKSLGMKVGENAIGMGAQSGGTEYATQMSDKAMGTRQETDPEAVALATLNGAITGGVIGGVVGGARGATLPAKAAAPKVDKDVSTGRTVPSGEPNLAEKAALAQTEQGTTPPVTSPATPAKGTLADQIAQEEQAPSAPPPPAQPAATPDVTAPSQPTVTPPVETPAGAASVPASPSAPVPTAAPRTRDVGQRPEPPIPQPPVLMPTRGGAGPVVENMPPRPKLPTERQAVPLEEPPADGVTRAEAQDIVSTLPQREPPQPEPAVPLPPPPEEATPKEVTSEAPPAAAPVSEPHIDLLNEAVQQAKEKPATEPAEVTEPVRATPAEEALAPAELVDTTKEGKSVFRNPLSELVAEAKAGQKAREDEAAKRQSDAERKREARFNQQGENEAKAKQIVTAAHPTDAEQLQEHHAVEQQALGGGAGAESAREILKGRAAETLTTAENAGVRVGERTRPTVEQGAAGEKNPTPYTSRLNELRKFLNLERLARRQFEKDPAKLEKRLSDLYEEHIAAERALRAGDLQGAAARRLDVNERLNARHKAGRIKEEAQRTAEEQAELDKLTREQESDDGGLEVGESQIRAEAPKPKTKVEHYEIPAGDAERVSTVASEMGQLRKEFDPANIRDPRQKAMAALLHHIIGRISDRVGNTVMRFIRDPQLKAEHEIGPQPDGSNVNGKFRFFDAGLTREGERGAIYIDNDVVHTRIGPQAILHEAVHAATNHAIGHNPRLRADLEAVHGEAAAAWEKTYPGEDAYGLHTYIGEGIDSRPDTREMVAEAWADPKLRGLMLRTRISRELARRLKLDKSASLWRAMLTSISRALGLGGKHYTLMNAIAHLTDEAMSYEPPRIEHPGATMDYLHSYRGNSQSRSVDIVQSFSKGNRTGEMLEKAVEQAPHISASMRSRLRGIGMKLQFMDKLGQSAEPYFGPGSPGRRLYEATAKMAHEKARILENSGANKLIDRVAKLARSTTSENMDKYGDFLLDETMNGVDASKPLASQKGVTSQGKARHGELSKTYDALSPEQKTLRTQMHGYFKQTQDEATLATIKNVIRAVNPNGESDDALAQKIFDNKLSDAEKTVISRHGVLQAIRNARALSGVKGPYFPGMRHGDHVVSGTYDVPAPKGAIRLNAEGAKDAKGSVYQFDTKAEAQAFAGNAPIKVLREQHVYTDPATGSRDAVDPATGEKVKLTKEDWAANTADEKWRVTLQPEHVEFFEHEAEARARHEELINHDWKKEGMEFTPNGVAPRRFQQTGSNASFLSHEFSKALHSLQQREGYKSMDPAAKAELERGLVELSLASLGSTRAQSRRLPRRFVKGASNDVAKSLTQYASSMSGFLARQKHMPEVDRLLKHMTEYDRDHQYEATEKTYPRGQLLKEFQKRIFAQAQPEATGVGHDMLRRLMQMSQMQRLASPAFHVINMTDVVTRAYPMIAARYGYAKTMLGIGRAYADIGAGSLLARGGADTARAFSRNEGLTNYATTIASRLKDKPDGAQLADLLNHMSEIGAINKDAGMEISRMSHATSNMAGRALDRTDLMARQVGTAVESINRSVTAIAEYRLAREAGLDHEAAKVQAVKRVLDTMYDYSGFNAPPVFNSTLGKLALQFKKFGANTYYLLGRTAKHSFVGDNKVENLKAFAGLMATHGLLAGVLGLPLEAIHAGLLAANLTGLTTTNYGDFEQWMRKTAAEWGGVGFGEMFTRGVPRYFGVDLSSRLSLADMMMPLGDPPSMKTNDLLAYAQKAFGGAPATLVAQYPAGFKALMAGDFLEASRIFAPLKLYGDSVTAYQRASVGRVTASGREKMSPYTPGEAFTRSMGFAPAREAEQMEAYSAQYGDQQQFKQQRSALMNSYVNSKGADKAKALQRMMEWNAKQPPAAKITPGEAERAVIRRQREAQDEKYMGGLRTTKRDEFIRQGASYYNLR